MWTVENVHGGAGDGGEESECEEKQDRPEATATADSPAASAAATVVVLRLLRPVLRPWIRLDRRRSGGSVAVRDGDCGGGGGGDAVNSGLGGRMNSIRHCKGSLVQFSVCLDLGESLGILER